MSGQKQLRTAGTRWPVRHSRCGRTFLSAVMMAVVVSLVAPGPMQADWELQTVDSATTAVALALDGDGIAHLCYFTPPIDHLSGTTGHLLKYANNAGGPGIWTTETIETLTKTGDGCDIAVAADGTVRVAYIVGDDLKYARRDGGSWMVTTAVSGGVKWRCALALDSSNTPHIAFSRFSDYDDPYDRVMYQGLPCYVTWTAGAWQETALQWAAGEPEYLLDTGEWQDIALSSDETVYGTWKSAWTLRFMVPLSHDPSHFAGYQTGLPGTANRFRIDAFDDFYAAGIGSDTGAVVLGRNTSDPSDETSWYFFWERYELDNTGTHYGDDSEQHLGLAADSEAGAHLVFYDAIDNDLKYIWQSASWAYGESSPVQRIHPCFTELVDSDGDVGRSADISVDGSDDPHIVYLDTSNHAVKYGKRMAFSGPQLRVLPSRWDYGHAEIWPTENRKEFIIMNPGSEDLVITSIGVDDVTSYPAGGAPPFRIWAVKLTESQVPMGDLPATIPPGEHRTFGVIASPDTIARTRMGELIVRSNWGDVVVSLKAYGVGIDRTPGGCGTIGPVSGIAMLAGFALLSICGHRRRD